MLKTKSNPFYALLILAICLFLSACSSPVPKEATTYIAKISNAPDSARVGIVIEDGKFVVYICSLDDAFNQSTARWFAGTLEGDGTVSGLSPDGVRVNGSIIKTSFTGIITNLQGQVITFRGSSVPAGGPVGLYRGTGNYNGQEVILGVIVDSDDVFVSTVQVQDRVEFITPISSSPIYLTNSNIKVTIGEPGQKFEVFLIEGVKDLEF